MVSPLIVPPRKKHCPQCGVPRTEEHFGTLVRDGKTYFQNVCRKCKNTGTRRYRLRNPAEVLWSAAKNRARIAGLAFSISIADVVIPPLCPVFGIPIVWADGKRTNNTPSLDRIHNTEGYTPGNVAVISWRANRLKSDMTPEEAVQLADYMHRSAHHRSDECPLSSPMKSPSE